MDTTTFLCGPPPRAGQSQRFPSRFFFYLKKHYGELPPDTIQVFAGSSSIGTTVDIREESQPKVVAGYNTLPFADNSFGAALADPPYTVGFAQEWVSSLKDVPKPKRILGALARVVKPGGLIFLLHIIVVPAYAEFGVKRIALHPVLCGPNNAIRVLNVLEVL